jgi:hypothetical protein
LGDLRRRGAVRDFIRDQHVQQLRREDAEDDGQLVQGHESSAQVCRSHLGDVKRREVRRHADGDTAEDAPGDELIEAAGPAGEHGGHGEQQRGRDQQLLAAELVAGGAGQ